MAGCKYCTGVSYVFAEFPVINSSYIYIAILKPGKDYAIPRSYMPISVLCHTYNLD